MDSPIPTKQQEEEEKKGGGDDDTKSKASSNMNIVIAAAAGAGSVDAMDTSNTDRTANSSSSNNGGGYEEPYGIAMVHPRCGSLRLWGSTTDDAPSSTDDDGTFDEEQQEVDEEDSDGNYHTADEENYNTADEEEGAVRGGPHQDDVTMESTAYIPYNNRIGQNNSKQAVAIKTAEDDEAVVKGDVLVSSGENEIELSFVNYCLEVAVGFVVVLGCTI